MNVIFYINFIFDNHEPYDELKTGKPKQMTSHKILETMRFVNLSFRIVILDVKSRCNKYWSLHQCLCYIS